MFLKYMFPTTRRKSILLIFLSLICGNDPETQTSRKDKNIEASLE